MIFSRKHYEKIAQVIKELPLAFSCQGYWAMSNSTFSDEIANNMATMFEEDNPRFDKKKFFDACGIDKDSVIRNDNLEQIMGMYVEKLHISLETLP